MASWGRFSDRVFKLNIVADLGERGGVIEIPVCRCHAGVDTSKTAGGGKGRLNIDREMLTSLAENFSAKPGPLPVYFGHGDRKPDTPAIGFVTASWVDGETLWNRIDLGPRGFDLIVRQKGFAGASIEAEKDKTAPTVSLTGWVQTGLAITNVPALDVQYLAASEERDPNAVVMWSQVVGADSPPKERVMEFTAEQKLALEQKIQQVETERNEALKFKAKFEESEARIRELEKRPTADQLLSLSAEVSALKESGVKAEVATIVSAAIAAGKPASFFEGAGKDPIAFLKTRFSGSVDALRASADALPVSVRMANTGGQSGAMVLGDGSAPKEKLFAEIRKTAAEKSLSFDAAREFVKEVNPQLYKDGMDDYRNTPLPGALNQ